MKNGARFALAAILMLFMAAGALSAERSDFLHLAHFGTTAQVRALVDAFGQAFPGGRLVYETESPMVMRGSEKQIAKHGTPVSMPFKVKDPYTPQDWSDTVRDYHVTFNCLNYLSPEHRKEIPARYRALFGIF